MTFGDDQEPDSESSESNDDDFDLPELDLSDLAGSGEERSEQDADVQIDVEESDLGDIDEYHIELGDEGAMVLEALEAAQYIIKQGDEEVDADARAAGDR